jgi:hypothetical protein
MGDNYIADRQKPSYVEVAGRSGEVDPGASRQNLSAVGGIRALAAIPGPIHGKESLVFISAPGRKSQGCIIRLDRRPEGSYERVREV